MASTKLDPALVIPSFLAAAMDRAEFQSRLDPACYTCRREGSSWIAEGPAGQRFDFSITDLDGVLVMSASGGIYLITVDTSDEHAGERRCDCPDAAKRGGFGCKHLAALKAVAMAAKMRKEMGGGDAPCPECGAPASLGSCPCEYRDYYEGEGLETEWSFSDGSPQVLPQEMGR